MVEVTKITEVRESKAGNGLNVSVAQGEGSQQAYFSYAKLGAEYRPKVGEAARIKPHGKSYAVCLKDESISFALQTKKGNNFSKADMAKRLGF